MTEGNVTFRLMAGTALIGGLALLAACGPTPVTRTVTTQTTTAAPVPVIVAPPAVTTTTVEEVNTPERSYVRPRVARSRRVPVRTEEVVEETTETQAPVSPVLQTTTRSRIETTSPR